MPHNQLRRNWPKVKGEPGIDLAHLNVAQRKQRKTVLFLGVRQKLLDKCADFADYSSAEKKVAWRPGSQQGKSPGNRPSGRKPRKCPVAEIAVVASATLPSGTGMIGRKVHVDNEIGYFRKSVLTNRADC
ncbi:MAG: hypothetical protein SGJ19_04200 [Planctomycetia bacterium]|nr:hypothetical protein [Planctomycetia bacterium]